MSRRHWQSVCIRAYLANYSHYCTRKGCFDGDSALASSEGHSAANPRLEPGATAYISVELDFETRTMTWLWKDAANYKCTEPNGIIFWPDIRGEIGAKLALLTHYDKIEITHLREHNRRRAFVVMRMDSAPDTTVDGCHR